MKQSRRTLKKRFREPERTPVLRVICATVGPGKARLLQRIQEDGSLSQAARDMEITYRQAWLMLAEMNDAFCEPLAVSSVGGVKGGGMKLTPTGQMVLTLYHEIQSACDQAAKKSVRRLHHLLKPKDN